MNYEQVLERLDYGELSEFLPKWQLPYFENDYFNINKDQLFKYINESFCDILNDKKYLYLLISYLTETEYDSFIRSNRALSSFIGSKKSLHRAIIKKEIQRQTFNGIYKYLGINRVIENNEKIEISLFVGQDKRFFELLDYQMYIKQQLMSLLEDEYIMPRVLVHMPTGTGKTKTSIHLINQYYQDNMRREGIIIWVANSNILLEQAEDTLQTVWNHLGKDEINIYRIYASKTVDYDLMLKKGGIVFANIASLINLVKNNPNIIKMISKQARLVFFDEAHKIMGFETRHVINEFMKMPEGYPNRALIGLTATPGRSVSSDEENNSLVDFFEKRIIGINLNIVDQFSVSAIKFENQELDDRRIIKYFQHKKILSKLIREVLAYDIDDSFLKKIRSLEGIKESDGDYKHDILDLFTMNVQRNKVILDRLLNLSNKSIPTIFFACSVEHGRFITSMLKEKGVKVSEVYGQTGNIKRSQEIDKFRKGENIILVNCSVLTTGFDATNIRCVFIARPTKSVVLYSQMIGRGLRGVKMGGNEECLLVDMKDNLDRFTDEDSAFSYFEEYWR